MEKGIDLHNVDVKQHVINASSSRWADLLASKSLWKISTWYFARKQY